MMDTTVDEATEFALDITGRAAAHSAQADQALRAAIEAEQAAADVDMSEVSGTRLLDLSHQQATALALYQEHTIVAAAVAGSLQQQAPPHVIDAQQRIISRISAVISTTPDDRHLVSEHHHGPSGKVWNHPPPPREPTSGTIFINEHPADVPPMTLSLPLTGFIGSLSLYGDHMSKKGHAAYRPGVHSYRVTLLGNRVPSKWSLSTYSKLGPEMLQDLGFGPLDYTLGALWQDQDVSAGDLQMALHSRAVAFGFDVEVVTCEWEVRQGPWGILSKVQGLRIIVKLGEIEVCTEQASGWRIPHAFHRAHLAVDAAIVGNPNLIKHLRPRHWHEMAKDLRATVVTPLSGSTWDHDQYSAAQDFILAVATWGGRVALDLEDAPVSLATLGVVGPYGEGFIVIIEEAPFHTLRSVCAKKCTLLTYSGTEARWLESQGISLPHAEVIDLQQRYLRNDANLRPGARWDEDAGYCVPTRDRRVRPIEQALAMHRTGSDPLYVKSTCQDKFFYPHGRAAPSIWASRPLADEHIGYAASDVVALLVMAPTA